MSFGCGPSGWGRRSEAQSTATTAAPAANKQEAKVDADGEPVEQRPSGETLALTKTPLDDALKILKPLLVRLLQGGVRWN